MAATRTTRATAKPTRRYHRERGRTTGTRRRARRPVTKGSASSSSSAQPSTVGLTAGGSARTAGAASGADPASCPDGAATVARVSTGRPPQPSWSLGTGAGRSSAGSGAEPFTTRGAAAALVGSWSGMAASASARSSRRPTAAAPLVSGGSSPIGSFASASGVSTRCRRPAFGRARRTGALVTGRSVMARHDRGHAPRCTSRHQTASGSRSVPQKPLVLAGQCWRSRARGRRRGSRRTAHASEWGSPDGRRPPSGPA